MMRVLSILAVFSALALGAVPVQATPSAVAALIAAERAHGVTDIEQPSCYVLQVWAQCSFGTGHGNAEVNAWLHLKNGKWAYLGSGGGVTSASMLESQYGIPSAVAKAFQAKQ